MNQGVYLSLTAKGAPAAWVSSGMLGIQHVYKALACNLAFQSLSLRTLASNHPPNMNDEQIYEHCKNQRWEALWAKGLQPGQYFDRRQPLPYLMEQVKSGKIAAGNRVLVPGCGRAYDVELLSRSGLFDRVIGADISPSAVSSAQ